MASIIKASINLNEIPKDKIYVGKKGKYLPITITLNDELDQFGNQGPVVVEQTKDERDAKAPKTYLGNVKVVWTNGMFPELLTRTDLDIFLPPIGGLTAYIFGDPAAIADPNKKLAVRVHDECNGSDVFGSDICTCRPYLVHGIEMCIKMAQAGGCGIIVYFRKEGRALG